MPLIRESPCNVAATSAGSLNTSSRGGLATVGSIIAIVARLLTAYLKSASSRLIVINAMPIQQWQSVGTTRVSPCLEEWRYARNYTQQRKQSAHSYTGAGQPRFYGSSHRRRSRSLPADRVQNHRQAQQPRPSDRRRASSGLHGSSQTGRLISLVCLISAGTARTSPSPSRPPPASRPRRRMWDSSSAS